MTQRAFHGVDKVLGVFLDVRTTLVRSEGVWARPGCDGSRSFNE